MGQWTMIDHSYNYSDDEVSSEMGEHSLDTIEDKVGHFVNDRHRDSEDVRLIICEGDSWFNYPDPGLLEHIFNELKNNDKSNKNVIWGLVDIANIGDTLEKMLKQSGTLKNILKKYTDNVKCVLLSAAGNDLIDNLGKLLVNNGKDNIDTNELAKVINSLEKKYQKIFRQ